MNCIYCRNNNTTKRGKRNDIQRYQCNSCNKYFQEEYTYNAYNPKTNDQIIRLLKECCGIRSISRILNISTKTVLSRMHNISNGITIPSFDKLGCEFEIDELWTYVGSKENVIWITYALERKTKRIINLVIGNKTKENIRPLVNQILLLHPKKVYTDRLNIYPGIIPSKIHSRFKYCTNSIERMNLTLRTHIKRLVRKTICFSKKLKYLIAHLRIYFWGNLVTQSHCLV